MDKIKKYSAIVWLFPHFLGDPMKKTLLLLFPSFCFATEMSGINEFKYNVEDKKGVISWDVSTFYKKDGFFSLGCIDMRSVKNLCAQIEKRECTEDELFFAAAYFPTPIDMPYASNIDVVALSASGYETYYITDAGHHGNNSFFFSKKDVYHYGKIIDMFSNADSVSVHMTYKNYKTIPDKMDETLNYETKELEYAIDAKELREAFNEYQSNCSL
ncbi:hypothetical protein AB6E21_22005 [Photobacterium swingsii]|uniref:hypothetical protein n=1 Tax=Photobacterium swingsii TaxID=680026 RepID=UPI00354C276F